MNSVSFAPIKFVLMKTKIRLFELIASSKVGNRPRVFRKSLIATLAVLKWFRRLLASFGKAPATTAIAT